MKASVIGATGFAGAELLRLLDGHPEVELAAITSESSTGENIAAMYPHLSVRIETALGSLQDIEQIADKSDVIFIALPHGHAMKIGRQLKMHDTKIIDLGGDYRFKDIRVFEEWYKVKHEDPETKAVYGLTELYRGQVKDAKILANPGCYTTCSILALVPLLKAGLIETQGIIIDAKSGTTGAGRGLKLGSLYCSVNENFHAYGVAGHRHTPEIEQVYSEYAGKDVVIQFTPHLLPVDRAYSTYINASYNIACPAEITLTPSVGFTPWKGMYDADGAAFTDIALKASKNINITDHFSLPLFVQAIVSPSFDKTYLIAGLSIGF